MRNKQTEIVPEHTYDRVVSLTCDLCGGVSPDSDGWGKGYAVDEITIEREHGGRCPDGGSVRHVAYHLCPACWTGRLVPWLESQGAKPTVDEVDW